MELNKFKILIVDDEETILELMHDYLSQEGYNVQTTSDPLEAIEIITGGNIHIVLSDIKMPRMNGDELLEKIKAINGLVQVIIMTGFASLDNTVRCLESGANDYLLKPFKDMKEVKDIINLTINKLSRWQQVVKDIYVK